MGVDIELYKVKYNEYIKELMKKEEVDDQEMLERILLEFGEKIGEYYILLNNEYYEDYNSYYNLFAVIDSYFKIDDVSPNEDSHEIFLDISEEMVAHKDKYDVAEKLNLEIDDWVY